MVITTVEKNKSLTSSGSYCSSAIERERAYVSCCANLTVVTDFNNLCDGRLPSGSGGSVHGSTMGDEDPPTCENIPDDDLNATVPAKLLRAPQDTTALIGDRVLLKATYLGRPEPTVRWTRAVSGCFLLLHLLVMEFTQNYWKTVLYYN